MLIRFVDDDVVLIAKEHDARGREALRFGHLAT